MAALIAQRPLAVLITTGEDDRLRVSHVPMIRDGAGRLRGHLARANPQWRESRADREALALFHGEDFYVSPSWYPSKREHGRVVPTWNYIAVEARGHVRFIEDEAWLRDTVTLLTDQQEQPRAGPWAVTDAPASYVDGLLKAIVGVEFTITQLEGKWKMSQNRPPADREGVEAGRAEAAGAQPRGAATLK